jgi:hypothetical protein
LASLCLRRFQLGSAALEVSAPDFRVMEGEWMSVSLDRLVRNQLLFREVNNRIVEVLDPSRSERVDFICECSHEDCTENIELDLQEYEGIRSGPTLFVVVPGHEIASVERVIDVNDRFAIVEKIKRVDEILEAYTPPDQTAS